MTDTSVQPTAEGTPQLSQMERVMDVFTAPSKTFTDIKNGHRSWWLPFLIMLVLGYVFFFVVNSKIGMRQVSENQIKLNPKAEERMQNLSAEQRESQMKISAYVTEGIFAASPLFVLMMGIVISAVMLGTINFGFGGKAKFGSVLAVWMYAMMPSVIKTILGIIVIYAGSAPESFNISNFAPTNLGAFLSPTDTNPALYTLATSLDVITIWTLALVGIGTSMVAGVKRSAGYIASFGWWAVIVIASVGWRAIAG
ncbi:YIP1 family protein [Acidobacteria bacterium AB60]|nr:YIP1 family protein [Acidobacteria bacterium AB60]